MSMGEVVLILQCRRKTWEPETFKDLIEQTAVSFTVKGQRRNK